MVEMLCGVLTGASFGPSVGQARKHFKFIEIINDDERTREIGIIIGLTAVLRYIYLCMYVYIFPVVIDFSCLPRHTPNADYES